MFHFFPKDSSFQDLQGSFYSLFQVISIVVWQALQTASSNYNNFPKFRIFLFPKPLTSVDFLIKFFSYKEVQKIHITQGKIRVQLSLNQLK